MILLGPLAPPAVLSLFWWPGIFLPSPWTRRWLPSGPSPPSPSPPPFLTGLTRAPVVQLSPLLGWLFLRHPLFRLGPLCWVISGCQVSTGLSFGVSPMSPSFLKVSGACTSINPFVGKFFALRFQRHRRDVFGFGSSCIFTIGSADNCIARHEEFKAKSPNIRRP